VKTESGLDTSAVAAVGEYTLSLRDSLRVIRRRVWVISIVAAVLAGGAMGLSLAQTPMYEASIKILVGQERGITETPSDVMGLQQLTQTMTEGVSSRPVATAVINQEDLHTTQEEFLNERLSVEQVNATQYIQVDYRDSSPERARRVANAVGDVFSKEISEVSTSANAITATVWERAVTPDEPITPNPVRNSLLALALGLLLGVGLAFLLEYLDDSWRSPEEMEQISGAPIFGIIPELKVNKSQKGSSIAQSSAKTGLRRAGREAETEELAERLVTLLEPTSVAAEAYRTLRTNLLYAAVPDQHPKVIELTSPGPGEGKSTTCANLGVVLAQASKDVLIVDCDFRKPVIHKFFGMRNIHGMVDVLVSQRELQDVGAEPAKGLKVIPVGYIPPNPTELLGIRRFSELLASFREQFDYVLIDAPPVGVVSDPAIIATQADGVLLISDAQNTRKGAVRQAMRSLEAVGATVVGTVMNNAELTKESYFNYQYYGSSYK
jgi:capsular exopolysaccharide synthesis family protein